MIFSEYVEGSSNNKAIEIVNLSGATVDLSGVQIALHSNGAATANNTLDLAGSLDHEAVYVICNNSAVQALKDRCDAFHGVTNFNGDDTLYLVQGGVRTDRIGDGSDPGTVWGTDVATNEMTLRRKCTITSGDTDTASPYLPETQWDAADRDDFSDVGAWHCLGGGGSSSSSGGSGSSSLGVSSSGASGGISSSLSGASSLGTSSSLAGSTSAPVSSTTSAPGASSATSNPGVSSSAPGTTSLGTGSSTTSGTPASSSGVSSSTAAGG